MPQSVLEKYETGYQPKPEPQAMLSPQGVKLTEYKAFTTCPRASHLFFKSSVRGVKTEAHRAFPYGALTLLETDGNGFGVTLLYSLPTPGPMIVKLTGKGLAPLVDAILDGTARTVQVFDAGLFLPVPEGDWNTPEHKWDGKPVVDEILIWDKLPEERTLN